MAAETDDITQCPVCFEEYREDPGDNVPRLLPCTHTVCEKCIVKLLWNKSLTCPECRVKHPAEKGVRTFSQNKYIITYIKRRPRHRSGSGSRTSVSSGRKENGTEKSKSEEKIAKQKSSDKVVKKQLEPSAPLASSLYEEGGGMDEAGSSPFNPEGKYETIKYQTICTDSVSRLGKPPKCGVAFCIV